MLRHMVEADMIVLMALYNEHKVSKADWIPSDDLKGAVQSIW